MIRGLMISPNLHDSAAIFGGVSTSLIPPKSPGVAGTR